MLKIVHLAKYYYPAIGGIESATRMYAESAANSGCKVSVICFGIEYKKKSGRIPIYRSRERFIFKGQPINFRYLFDAIRIGRCSDIVHLHFPNFLAALAGILIGKHSKVIVHWHSDIRNKGFLGRLTSPLTRTMLTRAKAIVTTSPPYGATSVYLRGFEDKIVIVPLGADIIPSIDYSVDGRIEELKEFLRSRRFILSVGRLVPFKGFETLVEAARHLDEDICVVIAGDGPDRLKLDALIRRYKLDSRVLITGELPPRAPGGALDWLFRQADVFCLPSIDRAESFGLVLIEAMSYGLPIVCSKIPGSGVNWVNIDGFTGFSFPPGSAVNLAEKCMTILRSKNIRDSFSDSAIFRFNSEFKSEVSAARMLDLYYKVAK